MFNFSGWTKETDPKKLKNKYKSILYNSGFGILGEIEHYFKPYGYTLLVLLSESHFAIHTFPEEDKSYIELSSCIEKPFLKFKTLLQKQKIKTQNGIETGY